MEFQRRSSGVAKGGLTTGIIGTSLGALNSLALMGSGVNALGNLGRNNGETVIVNPGFGGYGFYGNGEPCCSENIPVNRYELSLQQQIAQKDSEIALRDANTYNDQKMLEMYKYIDGQLKDIRQQACEQAVINQKTSDSFQIVSERMDCLRRDMNTAICNEARERKSSDNILVTYMNATFYPKSVADVTVGTTTTQQVTYNPLPCCDDCCNN